MFLYDPEKMDVTLPLHTWTATELLLEVAILATLIWYIQFLWSRRKSFVHTSNMPGPLYIPLIGSAMIATGDSYDTLHNMMELFREYPGIFRAWFGLKLFIGVSKPEYFEILLTKCLKKKYLYYSALPLVGDGIFFGATKIITPTFNQKILDNFVAVFSEQSNILVEQLKKHSGKGEFDIFQMVYRCTLDGICETAMGVKMNCQIKVHPYSEWVDRMIEIILQRITVIWYHVDFIFNMTPMSCELENITRNIHQFTANVTPKRKAFLDYLIEMTGDGDSKFTDKELTDEVTTFVIAVKCIKSSADHPDAQSRGGTV
ncbi:hypothetical protein NQ318_005776 [Aromia moschata]|uniref:Cytochrome P450 n=1 Tax=Aromia moschata TaxID=1265417 RepID=A0AAV8YU05_9CUCU|nr:hypothetical protein NQ318_005776 [Aromia moschata]